MNTEHVPTEQLLASARSAAQGGQRDRALELYVACLARGACVAGELAGMHYQAGNFAAAQDVLDSALAQETPDIDGYFQRGLVLMAMGDAVRACADFDRFIAASPGIASAHFQRALARLSLHRLADALEDFQTATHLEPRMADAWVNAGILLLRKGDAPGAAQALLTADRLAPGQPAILHPLASTYDALGDVPSALRLYAQLEPGSRHNPEFLTNHALCLLRGQQPASAHVRFQRALELAPADQTALAGLYIASNELGHLQEAAHLMDYTRLLRAAVLPVTPGLDPAGLRHAVQSHPGLSWEPAGRSTVRGQQSVMLDLDPGSPFHAFGEAVSGLVSSRISALAADPALAAHPWLAARPARWRLQAWATILHEGGHQTPHIHPAGWMSGVYYLDAGQPATEDGGSIVFGHPQPEFAGRIPPLSHRHSPRNGEVLMFPSYFFHHTIPYSGPAPRLSLAFDVIPT